MLMQSGLQKEDLKGKTPKKYNKNIAFMKNEMWYSLYEVVYWLMWKICWEID